MTAAMDAHVTVGFVVKDSVSPYLSVKAAGELRPDIEGGCTAAQQTGQREEGRRGLLKLSSFAPAQVVQDIPSGGKIDAAEHAHLSSGVKRLIKSVKQGLKAYQEPEAATEGLGGTYFFMNDLGRKIAIFKPCDEEPLAPNNPKGFVGRQLGDPGLKPTVRVGEAATREVAAYLLDHEHFARVPHTVMVTMSHPAFHHASGVEGESPPTKLGSLQEFVPHECDTSEMGSSRFSTRDVHRIGILDIRLMNTDRHAGNMLVRPVRTRSDSSAMLTAGESQYELIPIDHGFALPEAFEPPYFEWQHWPQAMMPFGKEELDYISRLDAQKDIELLRRELPSIREESLRTLEISTTLLKKCAAAGMSLAEIANVVSRPLIGMDEEASELEKLCYVARSVVDTAAEAESDSDDSENGDGTDEAMSLAALFVDSPMCSQASDADSDRTRFQLALAASDASRLNDDSLFNMDEDVSSRSPSATSPRAQHCGHALLVAKAYALTPAALSSTGLSFASPLSAASLGASMESASAQVTCVKEGWPKQPNSSSSMCMADVRCTGPASYLPDGCYFPATGLKPKHGRTSGRRRRHRVAPTSRLRKSNGQYPPLVEARCSGPEATFSCLTEDGWQQFMLILGQEIDLCIKSGAWREASAHGPPPASCPRF